MMGKITEFLEVLEGKTTQYPWLVIFCKNCQRETYHLSREVEILYSVETTEVLICDECGLRTPHPLIKINLRYVKPPKEKLFGERKE